MKSFTIPRVVSGFFAAALVAALSVPALAQTSRRAAPDRPGPRPGSTAGMELPADVQAEKPLGTIKFKAKNVYFEAEGTFENWRFTKVERPESGDIVGSTAVIEIDVPTLKANDPKLTDHLKTADFFDAEKFPKAELTIKDIKAAGEDEGKPKYTATGELKMHDMKETLALDFVVTKQEPLTIKGTASVDRDKWKIGAPYDANEQGSPSKNVAVEFETIVPSKILPRVVKPAPAINPGAAPKATTTQ